MNEILDPKPLSEMEPQQQEEGSVDERHRGPSVTLDDTDFWSQMMPPLQEQLAKCTPEVIEELHHITGIEELHRVPRTDFEVRFEVALPSRPYDRVIDGIACSSSDIRESDEECALIQGVRMLVYRLTFDRGDETIIHPDKFPDLVWDWYVLASTMGGAARRLVNGWTPF